MSSKVVQYIIFICSAIVSCAPHVIQELKPYPKLSLGMSMVGFLASALLLQGVQWKSAQTQQDKAPNVLPPGGPVAVLAVFLLGSLMMATSARAEGSAAPSEPQFGRCSLSGKYCLGVATAVSVVSYSFSTGAIAGGVTPQIGYGFTYHGFIDLGAAVYVGAVFGSKDVGNNITITLLGDIANWLRLGPGLLLTERTAGPNNLNLLFYLGTGSTFGGSSGYVADKAAH